MTVIEERIVHAKPRLDLLDHTVHAFSTPGGWSALCFADHGRKGWRGPLYLHVKEKLYENGAAWFNAMLDAWQHDHAEHARWERSAPAWDEIIEGTRPTASDDAKELGVPFQPPVRRFLQEFGWALRAYWDDIIEFFGGERRWSRR